MKPVNDWNSWTDSQLRTRVIVMKPERITKKLLKQYGLVPKSWAGDYTVECIPGVELWNDDTGRKSIVLGVCEYITGAINVGGSIKIALELHQKSSDYESDPKFDHLGVSLSLRIPSDFGSVASSSPGSMNPRDL